MHTKTCIFIKEHKYSFQFCKKHVHKLNLFYTVISTAVPCMTSNCFYLIELYSYHCNTIGSLTNIVQDLKSCHLYVTEQSSGNQVLKRMFQANPVQDVLALFPCCNLSGASQNCFIISQKQVSEVGLKTPQSLLKVQYQKNV